mmetsp:Transcript_15337/g.38454  ORF Transcript_15337/g.38454 Transcript_15337/m.38454 type:complete len:139 (-) Transcript_15337:346-762(-)
MIARATAPSSPTRNNRQSVATIFVRWLFRPTANQRRNGSTRTYIKQRTCAAMTTRGELKIPGSQEWSEREASRARFLLVQLAEEPQSSYSRCRNAHQLEASHPTHAEESHNDAEECHPLPPLALDEASEAVAFILQSP